MYTIIKSKEEEEEEEGQKLKGKKVDFHLCIVMLIVSMKITARCFREGAFADNLSPTPFCHVLLK